ncbi:hypothetical protein FRC01_005560 [Tulasnella sp. 417]|nr:hypothetical protein FRC01_005560 [Tulasnella sp. 417]
MAVRKKSEDDISVLILRLKNGVVRGSGQGTSEAMTINDFDQAFKRADSALQSHGIIANTSSSSLRQFRNAQRSPIYQLPLEVLTAILILASGVLNAFEYLALITFIVRLDLPVVTTIEIALGEAPEDNTTRDAIAFVVMAGIKPVIQRLSEWAGTIFVDLDQEDGVQLAFNNSTARASIKLFNFRWTGVMKSVINMSNAFVGRTKYLGVRGGGGEDLSSTRTELVELVTSLRFLIGVTLDGNPNCAELLDMLLDAGKRDAGLVEEVRLWQDLTHIEIEGCICDEMKDLLLVLEKWKDRRKKKLQKYLPYIAIRPGGCTLCAYLIGALEKLVDEGEQCSEAESDVEAGGQ